MKHWSAPSVRECVVEGRRRDSSLRTAFEAVGSAFKLSKALGISAQAISQWRRVPPTRVLEVERISGVPRHLLRPDLYPRELEHVR